MMRHPLLYSVPYIPALNRILNIQFLAKKSAIVEAEATNNWTRFLILHERPWRGEAFASIAKRLTDTEYWTELSWLWQDSENIPENPDLWDRLLRSTRPEREQMMSADERAALAALPEELVIYQGHTSVREDGWSYTTQRSVAEWFARRFSDLESGAPIVTTASVSKENVVAYLLGRGEYEILTDPSDVTITSTKRLR